MGFVEFFLEMEKTYAVVKLYTVIKSQGHLHQVKTSATDMYKLVECDEISKKLMYFKCVVY